MFPDAVSERGAKHLRELMEVVAKGKRGILCFCVQHTGICKVSPADELDSVYGATLRRAIASGVEIIAYKSQVCPNETRITEKLPVIVR